MPQRAQQEPQARGVRAVAVVTAPPEVQRARVSLTARRLTVTWRGEAARANDWDRLSALEREAAELRETARAGADAAADAATLAPLPAAEAESLRAGIERLLARRTANLSGGEAQRVAIGRALLSQPAILLFDEPLTALDQARREELIPYLQRVRDEVRLPMLYVSHHPDEVRRLADAVHVFD